MKSPFFFKNGFVLLFVIQLGTFIGCANESRAYVSLIHDEAGQKVDVHIDGKYFTSYLYGGEILKKPVLFPILTSSGKTITRGFPLAPRKGERVDHVHHYGLWFNHGDVNGVDYWNSGKIPPDPTVRYGEIRHKEFLKIESGSVGRLIVGKEWINDRQELVLEEETTYVFRGDENLRFITHTTILSAPHEDVLFEDSKEGVFAIRVTREMEVPSETATVLTGADLKPMKEKVLDNELVTGHYLNSNGVKGYPEVWGKRAKWMQLSGCIAQDPISICIFDNPENINHPPHWMARDYGLYGANGLGSEIYTKGAEVLNHVLKKGESLQFKNEVVISDGISVDLETVEGWFETFVKDH